MTAHRRKGLVWLALVLGVFVFGSAAIGSVRASNDPVPVGEPFGLCHAGYSLGDPEYATLEALGNQWMRIDFPWQSVEPTPGVWDYTYYDAYMTAAQARGQRVLGILDYTHTKLGHGDLKYIQPDQIPAFLEYVNHTVLRYRDQVTAFEIWNEPNHWGFWSGPEEDFFALFNATANFIHEIAPEVVVAGPGIAGHDPTYLARMFEGGLLTHVDALSFHPYSSHPDQIYHKIREVHALAASYGYEGEIWITEVGSPTGGVYGHSATQEQQAECLVKTMAYATAARVTHVTWYCLFDSWEETQSQRPLDSELFFGIMSPDYVWKPAAHAFAIFSAISSNSMLLPAAVAVRGTFAGAVRSYFYQTIGGRSALVAWVDDSVAGNGTVPVRISVPHNQTVITSHDILTGEVVPVSATDLAGWRLGNRPIVLTFDAVVPDDDSTTQILLQVGVPWLWMTYLVGTPIGVVAVVALWLRRRV
jgi:hypothetical protein